MAEYYERERLLDALYERGEYICGDDFNGESSLLLDRIEQTIDRVQTADVASVVRCHDCKHSRKTVKCGLWCSESGYPYRLVDEGGFCDRGSREES